MDAHSLDIVARAMDARRNRRSVLLALLGSMLSVGVVAPVAVDAKEKHKKNKKKTRGQDRKDHKGRDAEVCHAEETQCGSACCGVGELCCDPLTGTCISEGQFCGA